MRLYLIFLSVFVSLTLSAHEEFDLSDPNNSHYLKYLESNNYIVELLNFNDTSSLSASHLDNNSIIIYRNKNNKLLDKFYRAVLSMNGDGETKIYIYTYDKCILNENLGNDFYQVEGKRVTFQRFCTKNGINFVASTNKGNAFVINKFKANKYVTIETYNSLLIFDATGFTKAFNAFDGNPL
jgi:hypothetical protein